MIKNYIRSAFRSLQKNKAFTAINVLGLALGITTCLLIVFYVFDELGYDRFNKKADRIYRVNNDIKFGGTASSYAVSPPPLAAALKNNYPEVENVVRFRQRGGLSVKKGNQNLQEYNVLFSDPSVFDIFTLPAIEGDISKALVEPNTVVITESMAKKYFNSTHVVGRVFTFNDSLQYKITGVIRDMPKQSHFTADFFLSMSSLPESRDNVWFSSNFQTYVLLRPGVDYKQFDKKLPELLRRYAGPQLEDIIHISYADFEKSGNYFRLSLMPLTKIHLESNVVGELGMNGNIQYVYIFSAIAIFILLIACVNFMNLSTARSSNRAREVGVRKVLGSPRKYLIAQFLVESIMVTIVATVIALVAARLLLPLFNQLSDKDLTVSAHLWSWLIPALLVIILFIGCLAGSYPAFYLSGFKPIDVLKGKLAIGFKGSRLRSFLVIFQFSISIFLIIGTLVIYNQLKYIQNKDLGYNRNQVLIVQNVYTLGDQAKTLKEEINKLPGVVCTTMTGFLPTADDRSSSSLFKDPVIDQRRALLSQIWSVDEDYLNTLDIKLVAGRNFSNQMATDSTALIINETAAKRLEFTDALNKQLYYPQDQYAKVLKPYHIIGVVRDFNFNSLRDNITPVVLMLNEDRGALAIRIKTQNIPNLMKQIENKWKSISPNRPFAYSFMDQDFDATYRSEQHIGTIFVSFTTLAVIIACLGLFGLATYAAEQRTKEIGIRKVLGANMSTIIRMLSKDFIKLVLIAILIASPLAWLLIQKWLQGFAYRENIQWWILALAGLIAIIIAFITISFQSVKASMTNPVDSLRSE
jgi:putative ABC transport system permease protein